MTEGGAAPIRGTPYRRRMTHPMKPRQTTVATPSQLAQGWLTSLTLHGFLLCAAIVFARPSPMTPSTERFQWDVTLAQSTPMPEASTPATNVSMQPSGQTLASRPTAIHRSPRAATPYPKAVETVRPMADPKSLSEPQLEPNASMHQVSPQLESTHADPAPLVPPTTSEPSQPMAVLTAPQPEDAPRAESTSTSSSTIADPTPSSVDPSPSQGAAATPVETVSSPRPDYGWLQQAIFQRLEELKRSSRPQVDQAQPLKVLVKAVVSREGLLLDSMVVKSSGLDRIDREAMSLVQRAFPMQLDRPLNRQQVAMRIPITYSRE